MNPLGKSATVVAFRRSVFLCGLVLAACSSRRALGKDGLPVEKPNAAVLQQILAAWKDRQATISSLAVEWTETRTDKRHSLSHPTQPIRIPDQDTSYSGSCRLLLSGSRSLYEYDGMGMRQFDDEMRYVSRIFAIAHDGQESRSLSMTDDGDQISMGSILKPGKNPDSNNSAYQPLRWYCCPLAEEMGGFDAANLTIKEIRVTLGDQECILLEELGKFNATLWLSEVYDFNIVKVIAPAGATAPIMEFSVEYLPRAAVHWVPKSWTYRINASQDGTERVVIQSTVDRLSVNPQLGDADFAIPFPPKTLVTVQGEDSSYLVLEDGSERHLVPGQSGRTYDELKAASEPDLLAAAPPDRRIHGWSRVLLIIGNLIIVAAAAAGIYWTTRRRNQ